MNNSIEKFEAMIDRRVMARIRRDDRTIEKRMRRRAAAEAMIGELSSGKFYVYPPGRKYREGTREELIAYLMRTGVA